jgi:hypothetical protein
MYIPHNGYKFGVYHMFTNLAFKRECILKVHVESNHERILEKFQYIFHSSRGRSDFRNSFIHKNICEGVSGYFEPSISCTFTLCVTNKQPWVCTNVTGNKPRLINMDMGISILDLPKISCQIPDPVIITNLFKPCMMLYMSLTQPTSQLKSLSFFIFSFHHHQLA